MFTRISSITLAVLTFVLLSSQILEGQAQNPQRLYIVSAIIVILILASLIINFKRLNFTWPHLMLPIIYLLGIGSVFTILDSARVLWLFLLASSIALYFLEAKLGRESHFLQNIYLVSVFMLYLAMFAIQFYFNLHVYYVIAVSFILTYLLAVQGFAGFSLPSKKYFYLLLAVICAEVVWGLSFWPTHYFSNAVVLFCFFYLLWLFSFSAFFGKLTRQKVYLQLMLVAIVLVLTLSTTAWRPIK